MKKVLFGVCIILLLSTCEGNTGKNKSVKSNTINQDEAQTLVDYFDDHTNPLFGTKTRSVWFSYDRIHEIDSLLTEERKKMIRDGKKDITDGLRVYFARYTKADLGGIPYDNSKRNTLIFVSTKSTHRPIMNQNGNVIDSIIHLDYYEPYAITKSFVTDPQNRGELCPNNCQGATLVNP